jgi:hypothetical protein
VDKDGSETVVYRPPERLAGALLFDLARSATIALDARTPMSWGSPWSTDGRRFAPRASNGRTSAPRSGSSRCAANPAGSRAWMSTGSGWRSTLTACSGFWPRARAPSRVRRAALCAVPVGATGGRPELVSDLPLSWFSVAPGGARIVATTAGFDADGRETADALVLLDPDGLLLRTLFALPLGGKVDGYVPPLWVSPQQLIVSATIGGVEKTRSFDIEAQTAAEWPR